MIESLKKHLYFPIAWYFRFFATIRLKRWNPRIVVVTGSNGKTTLLHLLESQIGAKARYSHHANSSFGIPFDILDLHRKTLLKSEWITLILKAPFVAFKKSPKEKIYIVEADADRPYEGKFLAKFLRPEVVLWISISRTHSMNFDELVKQEKFSTVEEALAYEYGYFLEYCSKRAMINGDLPLAVKQTHRTKADITSIKKEEYLSNYTVDKDGTNFHIKGKKYSFDALLPEEIFYSIVLCSQAVDYLELPLDTSFSKVILPPGRGSVFAGIKDTTLIDSSYNGNLSSIQAVLEMYKKFPSKKKWVVIGDMMELGEEEQEEHEKLAEYLSEMELEKIILVGKRTAKYTSSKLEDRTNALSVQATKDVLPYLAEQLIGGETILFKGSQSLLLEGLIEPLLKDKKDAVNLPRRDKFWNEQRKQAGL